MDPFDVLDWNIFDGGHRVWLLGDSLNPLNFVGFWLDVLGVRHGVGLWLDVLGVGDGDRLWLDPVKGFNFIGIWLNPHGVRNRVGRVLDPLAGRYGVRLWLNPFSVMLFERRLRNEFSVVLFKRSLSNVFNPWGSNCWLVNVLSVVVFDWRRLINFNMLNLIGVWDDDFDDLFLNIIDFIVFSELGLSHWCSGKGLGVYWCLSDDSIIVEWIVVIEVLIRYHWV